MHKKIFVLIAAFITALPMLHAQVDSFGGFGSFSDTSSKDDKKDDNSIAFEGDAELNTPSRSEESEEETINRFKSPMKFTRQELNKISDPRVRDLYWYALNDTTDKKRYLRAHYAFNGSRDNWAIEFRAGVNTVTMNAIDEKFSIGPQFEIGFKKDVHPYWAVRGDLTWSKLKHELYTSHTSTMITDESWQNYPGNKDWWQEVGYTNLGFRAAVMLNVMNLAAGREMLYSPFMGFLYAGAGGCYSAKNFGKRDASCIVPQWFAGMQVGWNLNQRYSITLDGNVSWQGDDMEGYSEQNSTWKFVAALGLSYKFSKVIHFQRLGYDDDFVRQQVLDSEGDDMVLQSVVENSRDNESVELPSDLIEAAFFQIDRIELQHTYVLNLGFYAELIKSHPSQQFLVMGFADLEVGPKKRNLWLCEQRAKVVADVLVKTYGCDPDQLVVGGGDLDIDLPFLREKGHHRFNRCTIVCPLDKEYKIIKENTFEDNSELMDGRPGYNRPVKNY